ncbi:SPOR domain-containing protein [Paraburkholderia sp. SIMBA_053]|uniref:SPOR domain-containing protein n=1 Tax=Paraburkholderia sp. SIMBA_053 TaxID=3085794 RepID=UPI003979F594
MKKTSRNLSAVALAALALSACGNRDAAQAAAVAVAAKSIGGAADDASAQPGGSAPQRFAVQLGSFTDDAAARSWIDRLKALGVPAYAETNVQPDGSTRTLLRAGPFGSRVDALAAIAKAREAMFPSSDDAGPSASDVPAPAAAASASAQTTHALVSDAASAPEVSRPNEEIEAQARHAQVRQWWRAREPIRNGECDALDNTPAEDRHANRDVRDTPLIGAYVQHGEYTLVYRYPSGAYVVYASSERSCDDMMRGLIKQADQ